MDKKEIKLRISLSEKRVDALKSQLADSRELKRCETKLERAELVMSSIGTEKLIIDELCEMLDVCVTAKSNRHIIKTEKELRAEIKKYNDLIKEWKKLTKQKLPTADTSIPDYIISGREYFPIPEISCPEFTSSTAPAPKASGDTVVSTVEHSTKKEKKSAKKSKKTTEGGALTKRELKKQIKAGNKKIKSAHETLKSIKKKKKAANGTRKAEYILVGLAAEKEIVDVLCSNLDACCVADNTKLAKKLAKQFKPEIKNYNALTKEWQKLTGQARPYADAATAECIMAGRSYRVLPDITLNED